MSHAVKALGCVCAALAFYSAVAVTADSTGNPYQGIVDRNVFGLKDPPPPPPPPETAKQQGPPLTLTGIMNILGKNTAFISFSAPGAKPGEAPKPSSIMLTEGQRDGEIEVLQIDIKGGSVKVSTYGAITNLTFEKNGVKGGGSGAPAPAVASIPAPQAGTFTPGGTSFPGVKGIPPRMIRTGQPGQPGQPGAEGGSPAAVFTPGSSVNTSAGSLNFGGSNPLQPDHQQHDNLTPEQREIMLEANHLADLQKGDPKASLYPPSYLNPNRNITPSPNATTPQQPGTGQQTPAIPRFAPRAPGSY